MNTTRVDMRAEETARATSDMNEGTPRSLSVGVPNHASDRQSLVLDKELAKTLDSHSLESIVELKISRFLEQIGTYYPESLHATIMRKTEKPLLNQILRRTGGNQVHAARILGINRNTLRKKMKFYGFC